MLDPGKIEIDYYCILSIIDILNYFENTEKCNISQIAYKAGQLSVYIAKKMDKQEEI